MNAHSSPPQLSIVSPQSGETPTEFSAADYLQLGQASRRTMRVEVGDGYIDMVNGAVFRAIDSRGEGVDALMRLLVSGGLTGDAPARCFEGEATGPKNLDIMLETALLEAARQIDERNRAASLPRPVDRPQPTMAHIATPKDAMELGITAVLKKDYRAAYQAFCRAQELGERSSMVRGNIARLTELLSSGA